MSECIVCAKDGVIKRHMFTSDIPDRIKQLRDLIAENDSVQVVRATDEVIKMETPAQYITFCRKYKKAAKEGWSSVAALMADRQIDLWTERKKRLVEQSLIGSAND